MKENQTFLRPIGNVSLVQQVVDRLTLAMINKELCPGDKIPTETALSETFGVGRNSIREAIKSLVSFGVLEIRRPEGTFVAKGFSEKMIDPLLYGIILDDDERATESLKELRSWIDVGILRLAMEKVNEEEIESLEKHIELLKAAVLEKSVQKIYDADNLFHEELARVTYNPLFSKIANLVRVLTSEMRMKTIKHIVEIQKEDLMRSVHQEMLDVIKEKRIADIDEIIGRSYLYTEGVLESSRRIEL